VHALCDDVQVVPVHALVLRLLAVQTDPARADHVPPVRIRLRYNRLLHSEQKCRDACTRGPWSSGREEESGRELEESRRAVVRGVWYPTKGNALITIR
jgi:hypothetical protein